MRARVDVAARIERFGRFQFEGTVVPSDSPLGGDAKNFVDHKKAKRVIVRGSKSGGYFEVCECCVEVVS